MPKNLLSAIFLVILFTFSQVNSQTVISKYAGEFMAIGIGGRPLGMGGAYVAVANDVTAGYYNPAGLARINYPEISQIFVRIKPAIEDYPVFGDHHIDIPGNLVDCSDTGSDTRSQTSARQGIRGTISLPTFCRIRVDRRPSLGLVAGS